jgi:hypothetical protein
MTAYWPLGSVANPVESRRKVLSSDVALYHIRAVMGNRRCFGGYLLRANAEIG